MKSKIIKMEIKLLILCLFVVTFVQCDRYNEGKIGHHYMDRLEDESHITAAENNAELKDSIPSEDETRFKRQTFTHNPEWHKRHGIDMPHERNDTTISNNGVRHTHSREWHERHRIPMPGNNTNHSRHHHHHNHHRHPHRHHHRHFTTPIPTTTSSRSPTSCEIYDTASTPLTTPIWEIINPRGLPEGDRNIDFTTSTSTSRPTTTRPTTTRPTITRSTTTRSTTTEAYSREIYDVRRQDDLDNDAEIINMPYKQ